MFAVCSKVNALTHKALQCRVASSCFQRYYFTRYDFATQTRTTYPRTYKTLVYLEDGSSVTIRHNTPRRFIQMPLDLSTYNEDERRKVWLSRKGKIDSDDIDTKTVDEYDISKYKKFWK